MSVAKSLVAGRILEDPLFPSPSLRDKDREVLGAVLDAIDQFFAPQQQDFNRRDRDAEQPRVESNEDEEMSQSAGFILDKGSYPRDVLS
jgi:hypothetical protein